MPTQTVNLDKVEKQLADLLAIVEEESEIVISQNGKPNSPSCLCQNCEEETDCGFESRQYLDE